MNAIYDIQPRGIRESISPEKVENLNAPSGHHD